MQATEHAKRPSATKRGPGRYHCAGHERATAAKVNGAPAGFVQRAASPEKRAAKIAKRATSARQWRIYSKRRRMLMAAMGEAA